MVAPSAAPGGYSVAQLRLTDFRCYAQLRIAVPDGPIVVFGPNGAGKTNLLEALSFLMPGRGLRGARLQEVGRRETPDDPVVRPWAVAATVHAPDGVCDIGTGLPPADAAAPGARRVVRIDGAPAAGQSVLAERLRGLWLAPDLDRLFDEGAAPRRRFLDRLVVAFDPEHAARLRRYEHAMRERGRLLKEARYGGRPADPAWLSALEAAMAAHGVAIAAARRDLAGRLDAAAAADGGPFPVAALALAGMVEEALDGDPALAVEEALMARLAAARAEDAESGGACAGPHRSDLVVRFAARGITADRCSTGEQKALLISIVLAAARLYRRSFGAAPLLLLDEVAAHLDAGRRAALFDALSALGTQAWLTGTERAMFSALEGRAHFLAVAEASVTEA